MVGFFPTPYPDECLYSILCRYSVRCGSTSYESITKALFGNVQRLALSVYLPVRLECIDEWVLPLSGITRRSIAVDHTLHPYFNMIYTPKMRTDVDDLIKGGDLKTSVSKSSVATRSKVQYLKYCPSCAAEDNHTHGETYWHRQHQLAEMLYCIKHQVRLVDSPVSLKSVVTGFYPASSVIIEKPSNYVVTVDNFVLHKDKWLKIGEECEWLIKHGADIDWHGDVYEKYPHILRDKGLATFKGICNQYERLHIELYDYWGRDFLDTLSIFIEGSPFKGWANKIGKIGVRNFTPLHHILLMSYLTGSVREFVESDPAETPFGHPPYDCENPICPHHHKDGAEMVDLIEYHGTLTGHFKCTHCGLLYKFAKSPHLRGVRLILDYGHLWKEELVRFHQDPKMALEKSAEVLKCSKSILIAQKIKNGLVKPFFLHDVDMGAEAYYKAEVIALCKQYDEVTIALIDEKVPGAYTYLQKNDYEWIRSRVVFDNERRFRLEREEELLTKLCEVITTFDVDGYPDRVMSYGYIASLIGSTRDELRYKMSPNSELRALLDEVVEQKARWRQQRATRMRTTNSGQGRITRKRAVKAHQKPKENTPVPLSKREIWLFDRLRKVAATFESQGYPNTRLTYGVLANLIGSTYRELKYKVKTHPELRTFLDEIVEPRGDWRKERAAKGIKSCMKREEQIKCSIGMIWANPPHEQVSRNYIARVAGLGIDILKENPHLSELTKGFVETRLEWHKRRLTTAYYNKPIEGRPYSVGAIYRAASIDYTTYRKHRELFTEIVNNLNHEAEAKHNNS